VCISNNVNRKYDFSATKLPHISFPGAVSAAVVRVLVRKWWGLPSNCLQLSIQQSQSANVQYQFTIKNRFSALENKDNNGRH
jgi:hypothetical protein